MKTYADETGAAPVEDVFSKDDSTRIMRLGDAPVPWIISLTTQADIFVPHT